MRMRQNGAAWKLEARTAVPPLGRKLFTNDNDQQKSGEPYLSMAYVAYAYAL